MTATDSAVVDALVAQNARYRESPARDRNIAALRDGASAVVTGQQAGLFLGPLFTTYKAATAIALARKLQADRGAAVVPVFWLQTEDHDLAEIATCHVAPSRGVALELRLPAGDEHVSVAHRVLPDEVSSRLDELHGALSHMPHAGEHLDRLRRHYRPGTTWGNAFAQVLAELFGEEGLVLLDPRDPALAPLAAPVHRRALLEARPIAEALRAQATSPVHVREAAPLSVFHPDGPEGRRCRLVATGEGYAEVGSGLVHTEKELLDALDRHPLSFSTSALLRPILQDTWLPTAAYVAGPAEAAYFAQLPPLYAAFGLTMPAVVPRIHVRLLEPKTHRALDRLGLSAAEACGTEEEVLARATVHAGGSEEGDAITRPLLQGFQRAIDELVPTLLAAGEGMDRAIEKTKASVETAVSRLLAHYAKASRHRDLARVEEVKRLLDWLWPHGVPQERVYGISYFAAQHGERAFLARVLEAAGSLAAEPVDLPL
jgi:bacillithiol biosynthesis cysteine-adding enzyme BshC